MTSQTRISGPTRPELTMPKAEAALLAAEYARAGVILEYGSGGSTVLGAEMPGKRIVSVESDRAWAQGMRDWFAANPPAQGTEVDVRWANIGATGEWGRPVDDSDWRRYPNYPLSVWQDDIAPDVVLVDGRFRQGCVLASAYSTQKPMVLLFDDYARREHYHVVEEFVGSPEMTGRMARFDVVPRVIPAAKLLQIVKLMSRP